MHVDILDKFMSTRMYKCVAATKHYIHIYISDSQQRKRKKRSVIFLRQTLLLQNLHHFKFFFTLDAYKGVVGVELLYMRKVKKLNQNFFNLIVNIKSDFLRAW